MSHEKPTGPLTFEDHLYAITATPAVSAAEAAREAELRYRMLFESAPDAILLIDIDTLEILDANRAASKLFGWSCGELVGMSVADISREPSETRRTVSELVDRIPRRTLGRKDGSSFEAEIYSSQVHHGERTVRASFIRDITERLRAEATVRETDEKFAAAFAATPDAVAINRLADGLYVQINEGFTRVTGFTPEQIIGKSSIELGIWAVEAERHEIIELVRKNGFVEEFLAHFRFADGGVRAGSMSARIIDIGGVDHLVSVSRDISPLQKAADDLERYNERLADMVRDITATLGRVVEIRDPYTFGHQERVASVCRLIAREMGAAEEVVEAVGLAALVHDVGKLAVPAEILNKPGELSDVEFGLIKAHSEHGHAILAGVDFPWPLADIVLQHHERQDGSGYPAGLSGDEILPAARVLAIADVVEAMASHRPYRPSLGLGPARDEIEQHPEQFDAEARAACLRLFDRNALDFLAEPLADR